jgi:hypothetical protein
VREMKEGPRGFGTTKKAVAYRKEGPSFAKQGGREPQGGANSQREGEAVSL